MSATSSTEIITTAPATVLECQFRLLGAFDTTNIRRVCPCALARSLSDLQLLAPSPPHGLARCHPDINDFSGSHLLQNDKLCRMPSQALAIICTVSALTPLTRWSVQALVGAGFQDPRLRRNAFILCSPGIGARYHTHHNPHSHFPSGRYTLELSSDPHGFRRTVPGAPVLPCTPASFRSASAGPRVVRGSTVARSPSVGLNTHIISGRVSRFSCLVQRPRLARSDVAQTWRRDVVLIRPSPRRMRREWGRRGSYTPSAPL